MMSCVAVMAVCALVQEAGRVAKPAEAHVMVEARLIQTPGELPPVELRAAAFTRQGLKISNAGNPQRAAQDGGVVQAELAVHSPVIQKTEQKVGGAAVEGESLAYSDYKGTSGIQFATRTSVIEFNKTDRLDLGAEIKPESGFKTISAPRLLVNSGQKARVDVSSPVPYLAVQKNGTIVQTTSPELAEGMSISLVTEVDPKEPGTISVTKLHVEVTEVAGRWTIPNIAFNAGKPIMRTRTLDASFSLEKGSIAVVPVTPVDVMQGEIYLLLSAEQLTAAQEADVQKSKDAAEPKVEK